MSHSKSRAFTLVELLVVISIIALLVAMLLPVLSAARTSARQIACASTVRQIAFAIVNYSNDNQGRCVMSMPSAPAYPTPSFNWHHLLASKGYISADWTGLGADKAAKAFACADEDINSTFNRLRMLPTTSEWAYTWNGSHYGINTYLSQVIAATGSGMKPAPARLDLLKTPSSTYLVTDFTGHYHSYFDYIYNPRTSNLAINLMRHNRVANMSYVDGHVTALNSTTVILSFGAEYPGYSVSKFYVTWWGGWLKNRSNLSW